MGREEPVSMLAGTAALSMIKPDGYCCLFLSLNFKPKTLQPPMTGMEKPESLNLTLPDYFLKELFAQVFSQYQPALFQTPAICLTKGECVQSAITSLLV